MGSNVGQGPQILPLWQHHWYPRSPGSGESPAAGEPPRTGMGRDAQGLSSLPWAGLNPSADPRSLEQMVEIAEDTAPLEPEAMGRGDGDAASARGLPRGPLCCTVEQPMARGCHLPRASQWLPHVSPQRPGSPPPCFPQKQFLPHQEGAGFSLDQQQLWRNPKPFPAQARLGGVKVLVGFSAKSRLKAQPCSPPAPPSSAAPGHPCPDPSLRNAFCSNFVLKSVWGSRDKHWHRMTEKQPCMVWVSQPWKGWRTRVGTAGGISGDRHPGKLQGAGAHVPRREQWK